MSLRDCCLQVSSGRSTDTFLSGLDRFDLSYGRAAAFPVEEKANPAYQIRHTVS